MPKAKTTSKQRGLQEGYRSGLEEKIALDLSKKGISFTFETFKIPFVKPSKACNYTPDFQLPNGIIVESKGRFVTADRQKHILVQAQHPELDIRFVFSNSNSRISKSSPTTYASWCIKNSFQFADKLIPDAWLKEKPTRKQ